MINLDLRPKVQHHEYKTYQFYIVRNRLLGIELCDLELNKGKGQIKQGLSGLLL